MTTTKKLHVLDRKTTHPASGLARTLCGRETGRALGVRFGAEIAPMPSRDATCERCRCAIGLPSAKQEREERVFNDAIQACLRDVWRAKPPPEGPEYWFDHRWSVETIAGPLTIRPYGTWIAMKFMYPERANALLGACHELNSYSGKWNIHMSSADVEANLTELNRRLERMRP